MSRWTWRPEKRHKYSVYSKKTGQPVIIFGTADECAAAMGLCSRGGFYTTYTKLKNGTITSEKWEIYRDDEDDLDEDL